MKKRKNRLLYGALSGAFCFGVLCFAGGCGLKLWEPPSSSSSSSVSDSSSSDSSVEASEYLINGFNCMDDLYAVKPIGVEPTDAFVMDVNTRPEFVSEGKGSLVYQNVAGAYHEVFLLFENTAAADMDTQKISAVSVDVYNPNAETVGFSLLMKTYDGSTLFVEQANIAPNTWTTVRIDLTGYSYAQKEYIDGVSMRFDVDSPNTFYVDKIHAEMGATDLPPVDLNAVLQTISVPQGVERITEENFGEHVAFVEKVFYAKRLYDEDASGVSAENSKKLNDCLALMTDFAVLYDARTDFVYKGHYGSNLTVLSSEDTTYGAVWSISVPKTKKEQGVKHDAISVDGYGKVIYWLYNPMDMDLTAAFHGGWNSWNLKKVQLPSKQWTKIELNARFFEYDFQGQVFFVVSGAESDVIEGEFKMTSFFGVSATVVAKDVNELIAALPSLSDLTYADKAAVMNAQAAYNDLSSSAQSAVANGEKLKNCVAKIYELEAAPVIAMIDALPAVTEVTSAHASAITAAQAAYESLSEEAKEKISAEKTEKLNGCYAILASVIVEEKIAALPTKEAFMSAEGEKYIYAIQATKAEYDALTEADQEKVSLSAREKLAQLSEAIKDYRILAEAGKDSLTKDGNGSDWTGSITTETDETYGKVYVLNVESQASENFDFHAKEIVATGIGKVFFYVYNPAETDYRIVAYRSDWHESQVTTLTAQAWTKVEVPVKEFYAKGGVFYVVVTGAEVVSGWKVTSFYGTYLAAEPVNEAIEKLPEVGEVTLADRALVEAAKEAYEQLGAEEKAQVTNAAKLDALLEKLNTLESTPIIEQIDLLPTLESVALTDREAIEAARAAYASISPSAQECVTNIEKLEALEARLVELEAKRVEEMIDALPALAEVTSAHASAITAAQAAYESLSEEAKEKISAEKTEKLNALKEIVASVIVGEAIAALPNAEEISIPKDITSIEDVKTSYDRLSDADKAKISTELTEKLNACIQAIDGFGTVFDARTETLRANTNTGATSSTANAQTDEKYGNVFRLDVVAASHGQADFFPNVNFEGYDKIFFYVYNPEAVSVNLVWYTVDWRREDGDYTALAANAWTKIEVGAYYAQNNAFYLIDNLTGGATYEGWLVTSFYGAKGSVVVPDVEKPETPVTPEDPTYAAWEGWTKTTVSNNPFGGDNANQSTGTDETYGNYIEVSDTSGAVYFYAPWITDKTNYEKLGVYVYNCGTTDVNGYYNDWKTGSYDVNFTLKAGDWTLITFTDHYITINENNYLYMTGTFRFTDVYGTNEETEEPETPVTPVEPETPVTPEDPTYAAWEGWTKTTVSNNPFGGDNANQTTGTDETYGNYIEVSDTSGAVYFYAPWITDKTNYEKLGVYVYNCGMTDVNGYYNDWETGSYYVNFTLKAGEWTLITFTDHYITINKNNYLYMTGTFRFTDVYGTNEGTDGK